MEMDRVAVTMVMRSAGVVVVLLWQVGRMVRVTMVRVKLYRYFSLKQRMNVNQLRTVE